LSKNLKKYILNSCDKQGIFLKIQRNEHKMIRDVKCESTINNDKKALYELSENSLGIRKANDCEVKELSERIKMNRRALLIMCIVCPCLCLFSMLEIFAVNESAVINGDIAKYEHDVFDTKGELIFRFDNSDLIIETNGDEEFNVFAGRYKVDDGTVNTIERTVERNPLEGTYLLGEEIEGTPDISNFEELEQFWLNTPLSVSLEINNVSENSANFAIGGFVNRSMVAIMGELELVDGKWKYFDSFDEQYELEIEIKDNVAIVTGLNEDDAKLTGTYTKKPYNQTDEYEKYKEQLDATELYVGIMF